MLLRYHLIAGYIGSALERFAWLYFSKDIFIFLIDYIIIIIVLLFTVYLIVLIFLLIVGTVCVGAGLGTGRPVPSSAVLARLAAVETDHLPGLHRRPGPALPTAVAPLGGEPPGGAGLQVAAAALPWPPPHRRAGRVRAAAAAHRPGLRTQRFMPAL